ncbi:feruloyl esterase B precursor [Aspergillus filifer]
MKAHLSTPAMLAASAGATATHAPCNIATIKSLLPNDTRVFYANHYAENGTFALNETLNYGAFAAPHATSSYTVPKAACYVQANITLPESTQHSVGIVLPDEWNGRFMAVGNGEFAGSIGWADIIDASWSGFAAVSSDLGHEGNNGSFAYHNQASLENWGWRALHDAVVNGKEVTKGYYGEEISYSYYRGCSAGGKQGLKEVEMFPDDFDGVIAGAPAWWTTHLQLWVVATGIWNYPETAPGYLNSSHLEALNEEVLRQCDPQDGVKDNIIMDPRRCVFRPETLLCDPTSSTNNATTCLTAAQIETVNKLHSDWYTANDTFVFPGYTLGTESGWSSTGPTADFVTYIQYMMQLGSSWTWEDWNEEELIALSDKLNPGNATANDFDLSPFYNKGGKLLHYHGFTDPSIATGSSIYFYEHVAQTLAPKGITLDDWYRFFLVPGMEHCEMTPSNMNAPWYFNGDGQNTALSSTEDVRGVPGYQDAKHDVLRAIMAWVENGTAPDAIVATKFVNDDPAQGVDRQRPLCPYPDVAVYDGEGDVDEAASWKCTGLY